MFDKKRLKIGFRLIITIGIIIFLFTITPIALSRYEKEATSTARVGLAVYILDADYYTTNINLMNLVPRDEPYIYTFKIANNKDGKRCDTDLTYDLSLKLTTNMPLSYELYKNYDTNNNIITDDTTEADEDGTYFRTFKTSIEQFLYTESKENIYTLYVHFPKEYDNVMYQNLIEYIEINIDSRQTLD